MTNRLKQLAALMLCLTLALISAPARALSVGATVNSSDAVAYAASGARGTLPKGASVRVTAVRDGWARIEYRGAEGYIRSKYLSLSERVTVYVKSRAALYRSASASSEKLCTLGVGTKLTLTQFSGDFCKVSQGGAYGYVRRDCLSLKKPSSSDWKAEVRMTGWFDGGSEILGRGEYGYIYDVKTGISLRVKRMGGSKHADVEPASKSDTEKLKKIVGGTFSWDSRAVILYADGRFVAAAINTMPHGDQTIRDNGYDGQFCLHLLGSRTHGSDSENEEHQRSVRAAYRWARG